MGRSPVQPVTVAAVATAVAVAAAWWWWRQQQLLDEHVSTSQQAQVHVQDDDIDYGERVSRIPCA